MAHISDGTTVDATDWDDLDDRVANLEDTVATTGGTVGGASLDANEGWREESQPLSSTGSVTVTHNLGFTPRVWIQLRGNPSTSGPYITYVSTVTSTTFIVFFGQINSSGNWNPGHSGQTVTFDWLGKKGDSV